MEAYFDLKKVRKDKGQAVIVSVIFFVIISLALISGGTLPTGNQIKNSNDFYKSKQSYAAADSVNDNAFYMVGKGYSVSSGLTLPFSTAGVTATATVTDLTNKKQIITTGYSSSAVRVSQVIISQGFGTNFAYAAQIGTGGFTMNNSIVNGDVYSNGDISDGGSTISGNTTVAYTSTSSVGKIVGESSDLVVTGDSWAHEIDKVRVSGTGYCQVGNPLHDSSGSIINCDHSRSDPLPLAFPITATNITNWKAAVTNQTDTVSSAYTYNGDLKIQSEGTTSSIGKVLGNLALDCSSTSPATFGNLYVTGNVEVNGQCDFYVDALHVGGSLSLGSGNAVNVSGMSWIVGDIKITGSGSLQLNSSLGANSGYIISDGNFSIGGSGSLAGSGTLGSYIMLITTSSSSNAMTIGGGGSAALLAAPYGKVTFSNGTINGIVAKTINMSGGILDYHPSLANINFGGAAAGAWNILNWREVSN